MKKFFSLLLVLAMVIPMCLVPTAKALVPIEKAESDFTTEPFYALGWDKFDNEKYPYLQGLLGTRFTTIGDKTRLTFSGNTMLYGTYTDEDVDALAQDLKKEMDARVDGMRYLHMSNHLSVLRMAPKNVIFLDFAVTQLKEMTTAVLKRYKEIDGKLDGIIIDTEFVGMSSWYVYADTQYNSNNYQKNKKVYAQIVSDPRYATEVRPMLVERGFPFWENPQGFESELFSICYVNKGEKYDLARSIWDTVMRIRLNQYQNQWLYAPLKEYFPDVSLSDYQSHDSKSWLKLAGITDDGVALSGGNGIRVGTASCFSYYYARPGKSFFENEKQYASFNDAVYEASAFNGLLYDINFTRHMFESTDTKQIAPWITSYVYDGAMPSSMAYTPYYTELLYHLAMFDPEPFLSYTWSPEYSETGKQDYNSPKWILTCDIMNQIMEELTKIAGFSDRKPIEMPQYWNTEFIVSGMYTGGRNLWRVTPNTDEISRDAFKVEGTDPTFCVKGRTVTFPGGKILAEPTIATAGSVGYWVETAKDVNPIFTHDADRYEKYPSLGVNFDDCTVGAFTNTSVPPTDTWTASGKVNVVENGTGKALSFTGDANVRNVRLPAKITAGDSYAKDQAWEIVVTIPEGMTAEASVNLLKYVGTEMRTQDGGFKIEGGKVWYTQLGAADDKGNAQIEYKELMDIAPGTYKFRRVMNFANKEQYKSSYYVLDASGKELKSAKDVVVPLFTNINAITCYTAKLDKAVILDDYKLYPIGVTTDFELYDAVTGRNLEDADKENPRDRSIAYRLSWLNGSHEEKTFTVVADIYEGGVLKAKKPIKEIKMLPGWDTVDTGIVEVEAGQTLKVYLAEGSVAYTEVEAPATTPDATTPDATTPEGEAKQEKSNNTFVIVLVSACVVAVAAVVLALVLTKKKPEAKKEEPKEKTEE